MPSESMAELPVIEAAMNLVTAMRLFPTSAATMTFLDEAAMAAIVPWSQHIGEDSRRRVTDILLQEITSWFVSRDLE